MPQRESYTSLFLLFLRFGFLAWGGPVAQIAMIREELVTRQKWITPEKFARVLSVYQALPGPEAHELCVYFGMIRMGRLGGFLAGLGFMLPGFVLIILLAWLYVHFGAATVLPLCVGFSPAVTALIVRALHRMGTHLLTNLSLTIAALTSAGLSLLGVHFLSVFIICALWQALWAKERYKTAIICLIGLSLLFLTLPLQALPLPSYNGGLFLQGLQAGLLSFGGAYTAIPFLQDGMAGHYPNITQQSFLDGIALSGIIPAPLVIFGTYLGFLADGFTGAILMTLGIFIPAFSFTLLGHNQLEKIVENPALHGILDGISAAVIGLLCVTAVNIALYTITDLPRFTLFAIALIGLFKIRRLWATPAIILSCGIVGYFLL